MTMQDVLILHIDKENHRLNEYGNVLITVKHESDGLNHKSNLMFAVLAVEFDDISERLNKINVAVLSCNNDLEMLKICAEYINEMSFAIMNFIVKVENYKKKNIKSL